MVVFQGNCLQRHVNVTEERQNSLSLWTELQKVKYNIVRAYSLQFISSQRQVLGSH